MHCCPDRPSMKDTLQKRKNVGQWDSRIDMQTVIETKGQGDLVAVLS